MAIFFKKKQGQIIIVWLFLAGNIVASAGNPLGGDVGTEDFFAIPTHDSRDDRRMDKVRIVAALSKVGKITFDVDAIYKSMAESCSLRDYEYSPAHKIPFALYAQDPHDPRQESMSVVFRGDIAGITTIGYIGQWDIYKDEFRVKSVGQPSHKQLFAKMKDALVVDRGNLEDRGSGCCSQQ